MIKKIPLLLAAGCICLCTACGQPTAVTTGTTEAVAEEQSEGATSLTEQSEGSVSAAETSEGTVQDTDHAVFTSVSGSALETGEFFTERDLAQSAELSEATTIVLQDNEDIPLTADGVYVVSGNAKNATITVDAGDEDKVQIVLDGAQITNDSAPAIYVKNADKVFVTTTDTENELSVTGTFEADGTTNLDAVIFSRDDLILNGTGSLTILSSENGISGKDDVKITGGTLRIESTADSIEANESIRIADGEITLLTNKDGLHAENDEDSSTGYIYICGGSLAITAGDDAIHATTIMQMDAGSCEMQAAEGIEATWIQLNGGTIHITASDDGINAAQKTDAYTPTAEINGGEIRIAMGQGDTDAIDSNGNLIIAGGTIDISAQSPFDCDGSVSHTGGTIIVNGTETDQINTQMMGGGMGGPGRPH